MIKMLVLDHYYRELYQRLQNLSRGSKSVEDHHKKIKIFMIRDNVVEDREVTIAMFLNGLNRKITNMIELQNYIELKDMAHMATKIERQLKKKRATHIKKVV
jgi:hypothetical protein